MQVIAGKEQEFKSWVETNSKDGYSKGVVDYAKRWADAMEAEIAAGKSLFDVAEPTSFSSDTDGITGYMYGAAVGALRHFWIHGEDLGKWHNRQYLPKGEADAAAAEGKTVNPAVITIKT